MQARLLALTVFWRATRRVKESGFVYLVRFSIYSMCLRRFLSNIPIIIIQLILVKQYLIVDKQVNIFYVQHCFKIDNWRNSKCSTYAGLLFNLFNHTLILIISIVIIQLKRFAFDIWCRRWVEDNKLWELVQSYFPSKAQSFNLFQALVWMRKFLIK